MTGKEESIRERVAIRCARASRLLYSLASFRDQTVTIESAGEEKGGEIEDLRRRLAIEKKRMNRIKLCSLTELLLLVVLVLLLSTFFLLFFLPSP